MEYNRDMSCNEVLSSTSRDNSLVTKSSWPLNKSTEDSLIQGQPQPKVKYSQIRARRCLNFSLRQQTQLYIGLLLTGICEYSYLRQRLTLYKGVFSASIQWPRQIDLNLDYFIPQVQVQLPVAEWENEPVCTHSPISLQEGSKTGPGRWRKSSLPQV